MNVLTFKRICSENQEECMIFQRLMRAYAKELDEHQNRATPQEFIDKWIQSIIRIHGERGRYLELCYNNNEIIGFFYGKLDYPEHNGYKKIGYGYIMEFFVLPQHRRKGYGKEMYIRLERLLIQEGAKRLYLTSDPVTGKPFWESLGFESNGEISPENNLDIYEKDVT